MAALAPCLVLCLTRASVSLPRAAGLLALSVATALIVEAVWGAVRRRAMDTRCVLYGVLFGMMLPGDAVWWTAALALMLGLILGKRKLGGLHLHCPHPVLTAYALYGLFFSASGVVMPFRGVWMVLTGLWALGLLLATGMRAGRPLAYMLLGALPVMALFGLFTGVSPWRSGLGTWIFASAWFIVDPIVAPLMPKAQWVYGLGAGFLAALILAVNPGHPASLILVLLLMNVLAPFFDDYFVARNVAWRALNLEKPIL